MPGYWENLDYLTDPRCGSHASSQLSQVLEPAGQSKRCARYGAGSTKGVAPVTRPAIRRPVTGASVSPWWAWPKENHRLGGRGAGPRMGSMSGVQPRGPLQG